jgi:hypothetical protein
MWLASHTGFRDLSQKIYLLLTVKLDDRHESTADGATLTTYMNILSMALL